LTTALPNSREDNEGKAVDLSISWDSQFRLKLITTPSNLSFMWFRTLHLLSNPNRLVYWKDNTPVKGEVNMMAMRGISVCVEQMMNKGRTVSTSQVRGTEGRLDRRTAGARRTINIANAVHRLYDRT